MTMLDELCVKDVYIKINDYPNISLHAPIGEAIHIMHHILGAKTKYRKILVMDDEEHLRGYLTVIDLVRAVGPDYLKKNRPDVKSNQPFSIVDQDMSALALFWQEGFTVKMHDELAKPVYEYMTHLEGQVTLDDPIAKCLYLMNLSDVLILPVIENEQLVGVIRMIDLFDHIAEDVEQAWYPVQQKG